MADPITEGFKSAMAEVAQQEGGEGEVATPLGHIGLGQPPSGAEEAAKADVENKQEEKEAETVPEKLSLEASGKSLVK